MSGLLPPAELQKYIVELEAEVSKQVDEKRMWKARAEAAMGYAQLIAFDLPLALRLCAGGQATGIVLAPLLGQIAAAQKAHDVILKDAWTQTTRTAKAFVKSSSALLDGDHSEKALETHIEQWMDQFRVALGE